MNMINKHWERSFFVCLLFCFSFFSNLHKAHKKPKPLSTYFVSPFPSLIVLQVVLSNSESAKKIAGYVTRHGGGLKLMKKIETLKVSHWKFKTGGEYILTSGHSAMKSDQISKRPPPDTEDIVRAEKERSREFRRLKINALVLKGEEKSWNFN